jgi:hypothetical protein
VCCTTMLLCIRMWSIWFRKARMIAGSPTLPFWQEGVLNCRTPAGPGILWSNTFSHKAEQFQPINGRRLCHLGERDIPTAGCMQETCKSYPDARRESLPGGEKTHAVFSAGLVFRQPYTCTCPDGAHQPPCLGASVHAGANSGSRSCRVVRHTRAPNQICGSTLPMPLVLARWGV